LLFASLFGVIGAFSASATAFMMPEPAPPSWDPNVLARPPVGRAHRSPPISGGTLTVLRSGHVVVASDPDRDRLLVVDLDAPPEQAITRVEQLPIGSEPGRVVQGSDGRVHVVLRGSGQVLSLRPTRQASPPQLRSVCPMPRGLAAQGDELHVACRGGELVTFTGTGAAPTRRLELDRDLRDVFVVDEHLYVTRFRAAEVLEIAADGALLNRRHPGEPSSEFAPRVAWRARRFGEGIALLHQREKNEPIATSAGGYGHAFSARACQGIVRTALSFVGPGDAPFSLEVGGVVLPVDFDVRVDSRGALMQISLVSAGRQNGERSVIRLRPSAIRSGGCQPGVALPTAARLTNPIAIAYAGERLVVQQREPSALAIIGPDGTVSRRIELGGGSAFDTGHAIFHAGTAAAIACASCHPEGGEDGHTWNFTDVGIRRTPALHSVAGTAPFHWSGDIEDMEALVNEVFVRRMTGRALDIARVDALEAWIGHLPTPTSSETEPGAVERGRAIFEGVGRCSSCHSGPRRSSGRSEDVGRGEALQVPSLVGVTDRLPLMHDGCATSLRERFDPGCGGQDHGGAVEGAALDDLIAYLESL